MQSREQRLAELLKKFGLDDVGEETVDNSSTDESKVINTPPATVETPVPPSRTRVKDIKNNNMFLSLKNRHNKDFLSLNSLSLNNFLSLKNAGARVREATTDNSDKFKQWRKTKFGGDFDPVAEAVGEALRAFKPDNPELTRKVWLKIANAIGYSNFLDAMYQQQSLIQEYENRGKKCWNKALLFHRLLNQRFPLPKSKGGAK